MSDGRIIHKYNSNKRPVEGQVYSTGVVLQVSQGEED
jgi:hypothetical protein